MPEPVQGNAPPKGVQGSPPSGDGQEQGHETAFSFKTADDFNSAVTSRLKPLKTTIEGQRATIEELKTSIGELKELIAGKAGEDGKKPDANAPAKPDPQLAAMKKQLDELNVSLTREQAEKLSLRTQQAFEKAAQAAGFVDTSDLVYAYFKDRIKLSADDGKFYVGEESLEDSLKKFAGEEKGKRLLPPKPAAGGGARAGERGAPGTPRKPSEQEVAQFLLTGGVGL